MGEKNLTDRDQNVLKCNSQAPEVKTLISSKGKRIDGIYFC